MRVDDLKQAEGLDGLLCLWGSGTHAPCQASDLAAKALAQLQTAATVRFSPQLVWVTQQAVATSSTAPEQLGGLGASPL